MGLSKSKKRWEGCTYCGANLARERVDERPHEEEDDVNGEEAGDGRPQLPGDHLRLQQREGETDLILSETDTRDGAGDVRRVLLAGELCAQVICLGWGRREWGEHCRAKPEQKQSIQRWRGITFRVPLQSFLGMANFI